LGQRDTQALDRRVHRAIRIRLESLDDDGAWKRPDLGLDPTGRQGDASFVAAELGQSHGDPPYAARMQGDAGMEPALDVIAERLDPFGPRYVNLEMHESPPFRDQL
jgi:hypothetical protein